MTVFPSIELYGIGFDRDVELLHEASNNSRGTINLPMSTTHQEIVQCRTRFMVNGLHPQLHSCPSQTSSSVELIPEPAVAVPAPEMWHVRHVAPGQMDPFQSIERVPAHLTPINRYVDNPERHERIAYSLAAEIKFEKPWQDYLPCPGSGPLSAAGSTTSDVARKPGIAKAIIPAPVYGPPSPEPYRPVTPEPIRTQHPIDEPPLMIRRYLDDPHDPDWVSLAQDQSRRLQSQTETRQTIPHWNRGLHHVTYPSAAVSENAVSEAPRSVGGSCLGKRPMPDWESECLSGIPHILVPDDTEEASKTVALNVSSSVLKEQREALQAGRPRAHKIPRVHKRKMKSSQGSSSPVSSTKELPWWR
ncbi:hypothetical protein V8F20_011301 [Naviculisporaceae sp. PSN 640]